jgi:hypothetical protein
MIKKENNPSCLSIAPIIHLSLKTYYVEFLEGFLAKYWQGQYLWLCKTFEGQNDPKNHCKLFQGLHTYELEGEDLWHSQYCSGDWPKIEEKKNVVKISSLVSEHLWQLMQGLSDKYFGLLFEKPALSESWVLVCFGSFEFLNFNSFMNSR